MAFFFNLGNFVKESIGYLNVSAKKKKKKRRERREQGFSSFDRKSNTRLGPYGLSYCCLSPVLTALTFSYMLPPTCLLCSFSFLPSIVSLALWCCLELSSKLWYINDFFVYVFIFLSLSYAE